MKVLGEKQLALFCFALEAVAAPQYHPHLNPWPRPVNEKLPTTTTTTTELSTEASLDVPRPVITLLPFESDAKPTDEPKETTIFLEYKSDGDVKTADGEQWMEKYEDTFNKLSKGSSKSDVPVDNVKRESTPEPQPQTLEDLPEKMTDLTGEQVQQVEQFLLPLFSQQFLLPWFRDTDPDSLADCMNMPIFKLDKTDPKQMLTYMGACAMMNSFERNKPEPVAAGVTKRSVKPERRSIKLMDRIYKSFWKIVGGQGVKDISDTHEATEAIFKSKSLNQAKARLRDLAEVLRRQEQISKTKSSDEEGKRIARMEESVTQKLRELKLRQLVASRDKEEKEEMKKYVGVNINSTVPGADFWNWWFHGVPLVKELWDPTWKTGFVNYPTPEEQQKASDEYDRQQAEKQAKKLAKWEAKKAKEDETMNKEVDEIIELADQEVKEAADKDAGKFQKRGLWDDRTIDDEEELYNKRCLLPEELEQLKKESAEKKKIQPRGCLDPDLVNEERGLWDDRSIPEELSDDEAVEERGLWDDRSIEERGLWDDRSVEENDSADDEIKPRDMIGVKLLQKGGPSPFPSFGTLVEFAKAIEKADNKTIDAIDAELSEDDAQMLSMLLLGTFAKSAFEPVHVPKPEAEAPEPEVQKPESKIKEPESKIEKPKPEFEEPKPKVEEPKPKTD